MLAEVSGGISIRCGSCSGWIAAGSGRYGNPGGPSYCPRCGMAYNTGFQAGQEAPEPAESRPAAGGQDDGGPAYPCDLRDRPDILEIDPDGNVKNKHSGMSLRTRAAIDLKVDDSEVPFVNDMIRKSQRRELAGLAMQGMLASDLTSGQHGKTAYEFADEVLAESSKSKNPGYSCAYNTPAESSEEDG